MLTAKKKEEVLCTFSKSNFLVKVTPSDSNVCFRNGGLIALTFVLLLIGDYQVRWRSMFKRLVEVAVVDILQQQSCIGRNEKDIPTRKSRIMLTINQFANANCCFKTF